MRLKRLERAWKALWRQAISGVLGTPRRLATPDWEARPYRVLFLRHDRLGDMILSTGVMRAIAERRRTVRLDVLASPSNATLLRHDRWIGRLHVLRRGAPWSWPGLLLALRRERYDAVIDCMVTGPSLTTLLLMLASGAPVRIGVARRGNDAAYTLPVEPAPEAAHIVEHLAALAAPFGVGPGAADVRPRLTMNAAELSDAERTWDAGAAPAPRVLVNLSAGRDNRRWPAGRYVAAIRHLRARLPEARVLLLADPRDAARASDVATETGVRWARTDGIRAALALVATADLVITPDTSISHAASAFGTRAVVLMPSNHYPRWGLYGAPGTHVVSRDRTLTGLALEPVVEALDRVTAAVGVGEEMAAEGRRATEGVGD
ncbi:MAG TPA: glycosyltransferase family 9 protein [Gemmatimonadaceae bacterium]|nr:glycosyltransferase family 9 protein [Gemmatimonadaceae bacterium]